ncbi:MAG: RES family NAD+ phosphorylase [Armatimonadota bacterium]
MAQPSVGGPDALGGPPEDLSERSLPLVPFSDMAYRVYWLDRDPRYFGKTKASRFNDPLGDYGVMYAAVTPEGAFAETLLPRPGVLTLTTRAGGETVPVSGAMIAAHGLARVTCTSPLQCVDLSGEHLASIGADASVATGRWRISQQWSRAFFTHPSQPDAILYRGRRDPSLLSLAIHERAGPKITVTALGGLSEPHHAGLLAAIIRRYHVVIVPSR